IRELESGSSAETAPAETSFLGGGRESFFGKREGRGAVPSVRPGEPAPLSSARPTPATQPMPAAPTGAPMAPGGSFLRTAAAAAAAAAGVIGGSLLLSSIRSMMGGHQQGAHAAFDPGSAASGSPWSGAGGELSRQAGLDDVGRASSSGDDSASRGYGLLDD